MLTPKRGRLTSAHVIALVALFVALGGTTWAATQLGKGTVKAKNLAKNAVTTKKIKDGAVTAPKIAGGVIPSVAFAKVNADGTRVAAQSKNVVGVTKAGGNGLYCIDASGPVPVGVATPTAQAAVGSVTAIQIPSTTPACPSGTDAAVFTGNPTASDEPFFVVLY